MTHQLASIPLALFVLTACDLDQSDVAFRNGEGGAAATGGTGGVEPVGGAGGEGGGEPVGGAGGAAAVCPDGMATIATAGECYADGSCFELPDGRWCTGGAEVDCSETTTPVWFSESEVECLASDACAAGFGAAPDAAACPRNGACYQLLDGSWCAQWRTEQRCPRGFAVVATVGDCAADATCYELSDGAWCSGEDSDLDPAVLDAISGYRFEVEGDPEVLEVALPTDPMASAQWGVVEGECQVDGYTLLPYAGQTVNLTRYAVNRTCQDHPIDLRVMTQGETLICVYFTAVPSGDAPLPGVYSTVRGECR